MSNRKSISSDQTQPEAAPNLIAAIGHSLQAAADLCGKEQVKEFFQDMIGDIVQRHFPIDAGGLINAKCKAEVGERINSLLTQ